MARDPRAPSARTIKAMRTIHPLRTLPSPRTEFTAGADITLTEDPRGVLVGIYGRKLLVFESNIEAVEFA